MRTRIFSIYFLIVLVLFNNKGACQNYSSGFRVKMDGYIINLGGEILFQPCEDSTINIWESMDNRSFSIWCNQINDQYCEAIDNIGDSIVVQCFDSKDSTTYNIKFAFFYCSLEIDMGFLTNNENDFKIYKKPQYEILYNQKRYPLKGFYIREWVKKIIPKNRRDLLLMYRYYSDRGYTVPIWLAELVNGSKKKGSCKKGN